MSSSDTRVRVYAAIFKAWRIIGGADVHPELIVNQVRHIECSTADLGLLLWEFAGCTIEFDFRENTSLPAGKVIVEFK